MAMSRLFYRSLTRRMACLRELVGHLRLKAFRLVKKLDLMPVIVEVSWRCCFISDYKVIHNILQRTQLFLFGLIMLALLCGYRWYTILDLVWIILTLLAKCFPALLPLE